MFRRYWWVMLVMVPVGMILGVVVAAVVNYYLPKVYESTVVIEVKPRTRSVESPSSSENGRTLPQYMTGSEFEPIKSRRNFTIVIERLGLLERWKVGEEEALTMLKESVTREDVRGTDLIRIRVRRPNAVEARDIAAEVVKVYVEYRRELVERALIGSITEARNLVREQEDKVEELRKVLITVERVKKLIYEEPGGVSETKEFDESGSDYKDRAEYKNARLDFETELDELEEMKLELLSLEIEQEISSNHVVVHEESVLADVPVLPNVRLNLLKGIFWGGLVSPFFALPVMAFLYGRSKRVGES